MRHSSHMAAMCRNGKALPKASLPLFEWANAMASRNSALPLPRAVRIIAHRSNLSPTIARLFAEQAGLFLESENG
jgi:hypothetical protein